MKLLAFILTCLLAMAASAEGVKKRYVDTRGWMPFHWVMISDDAAFVSGSGTSPCKIENNELLTVSGASNGISCRVPAGFTIVVYRFSVSSMMTVKSTLGCHVSMKRTGVLLSESTIAVGLEAVPIACDRVFTSANDDGLVVTIAESCTQIIPAGLRYEPGDIMSVNFVTSGTGSPVCDDSRTLQIAIDGVLESSR